MSMFTINNLISIANDINTSATFDDFISKQGKQQEERLLDLMSIIIREKIERETTFRKKRVVKLIQFYLKTEDHGLTLKDLKEWMNDEDTFTILKEIFGTKRRPIDDDGLRVLINDINDFFDLFDLSTDVDTVFRNIR